MRQGYFILNGISSEEFTCVIQDRPEIETPRRKVEFKSSYGQSESMPFDEEAYENTEMELICYVEGSENRSASDNRALIRKWFDSGRYMDFIPYFDPNKVYKVMTISPPKFSPKVFMDEGQPFEVGLTIKPYKFYLAGPNIDLTATGAIFNPSAEIALPVIKVFGTGDVTLTVNGVPFVIKSIVDTIVLECNLELAYREVGETMYNENSKIYTRAYPFLKVGSNTISWTGTVTKVEIEPRWRTLA